MLQFASILLQKAVEWQGGIIEGEVFKNGFKNKGKKSACRGAGEDEEQDPLGVISGGGRVEAWKKRRRPVF